MRNFELLCTDLGNKKPYQEQDIYRQRLPPTNNREQLAKSKENCVSGGLDRLLRPVGVYPAHKGR